MYGEALRLVRTFHEESQSNLAQSLSISRSYLSELESGKKNPSLDLLQRYSIHFSIPLSTLVLFSESDCLTPEDVKVKSALSRKAVAILQWIERKASLNG
jgi:transcriptional regulator with XRE-family HTH domain